MLSKIFKKNETPPPPILAPKQATAPAPAEMAAQLADKASWESKLQAAAGDDAALLAIAKESPLIEIKHAAVEALVSEDALKRAEREFRDHDRRVHRTAKQRYETLVNRRVAGVSAAKLIETAAVLLHESSIPANRLVELDRAWTALDARKAGFNASVIEDASRGIDLNGSVAKAWADMSKAGVKRVQSSDFT